MPVEDVIDPNLVPMGGNIVPDKSGATFRCWAPGAKHVYIRGDFNAWDDPLSNASLLYHKGNYWMGFVRGAKDGDPYKFYVEGEGTTGWKRDPYARELTIHPQYPFCNCILHDPDRFQWHDSNFQPPKFHELIIYQLHVGVFNGPNRQQRVAKFLDILGKFDYLIALGINAILLLPIVEFDNSRSLGYEGCDIFSPEMDYSVQPGELNNYLPLVNGLRQRYGLENLAAADLEPQSQQLKVIIELFHLAGIAVHFDVVYNHAGSPIKGQDESIWFFDRAIGTSPNDSLYFTDQDYVGPVWAIWKQEVRQFLIDNAVFFTKEFHIDGLRYDQASEIVNKNVNNGWGFCQDVTSTVRSVNNEVIQIAEYWNVDPYVVRIKEDGGAGFDACWHDGLRTTVRQVLGDAAAGDRRPLAMDNIAAHLWSPNFSNAWRSVQCLENHDIVYREREQRIPKLAGGGDPRIWFARSRSRAATGILLTAPGVPMLFMGQEFLAKEQWADDATNHPDMLIDWDGLDWGHDPCSVDFHRFVEALIWLRRSQPALTSETLRVICARNADRILVFHRWMPGIGQDVVVVVSLNDDAIYGYRVGWPETGTWREIFNSDCYDSFQNRPPIGNNGSIVAWDEARDELPATVNLVIPPNSILVFSR